MNKFIGFIFILSFFIDHLLYCQTWKQYDSLRAVYQKKQYFDTALVYAEKALQTVEIEVGKNDTLYANQGKRI